MKFKVWLCSQNIKRVFVNVYNNHTIKWLRNTLMFNIVRMFLIVFLILWVIFLFAPKTAHVSLCTDEVDAVGEIYADHINMNLVTDRFTFSDFEEINLGNLGSDGYMVNNEFYDSSYEIYAKSYDGLTGTIFITTDNTEEFNFISFANQISQPVYINYMDSKFSIKCKEGVQLKYNCNIQLTFCESDAFLIKEGQEDIPIHTCVVKNSNRFGSILTTQADVALNVFDYLGVGIENKADISLWGVNKIFGKASGDLYFSYSPTSKRYHLNKQIIYLESEDNSLETDVELKSGIHGLNINGMVDEATISKMNLFPTFFGWYRDNIYLAPLTLLTTIFGGVTMMINNKKKYQ